jgi:hypothetical protein
MNDEFKTFKIKKINYTMEALKSKEIYEEIKAKPTTHRAVGPESRLPRE